MLRLFTPGRYWSLVLDRPGWTLLGLLALTVLAALGLPRFALDAGSEALVLRSDPKRVFYDRSRLMFSSDEYLMIAGHDPALFTPEGVARLERFAQALAKLPGISAVLSPTNVPLFRSGREALDMAALLQGERLRLTSPGCVLEQARAELSAHRVFGNNLVAADGEHWAVIADLERPAGSAEAEQSYFQAQEALEGAKAEADRAALKPRLAEALARHEAFERVRKADRHRIVPRVYALLDEFERQGSRRYYVAGVPMIVVEMIEYLKRDILLFGALAAALVAIFLGVIFRRATWVLLPLVTAAATAAVILGAMAWEGRKTTVITCNMSSLLLIISLAQLIHLIVRFQEARARTADDATALRRTIASLASPCLYTALTTFAGFASLWVSDIQPVMEFGVYMSAGVMLSFALSFLAFPAWIRLLGAPAAAAPRRRPSWLLARLAELSYRRRFPLLAAGALVAAISIWGMSRMVVETRFIDYFQHDTRLFQSLDFLDRKLGGTTMLELVVTGPEAGHFQQGKNLNELRLLAEYLEAQPAVGKVISYREFLKELQDVLELAQVPKPLRSLPVVIKQAEEQLGWRLLSGYVTPDYRSARVVARIRESVPALQRVALQRELAAKIATEGWFAGTESRTTGIFVLYTNMLDSLWISQKKSGLLILVAIAAMLALLFRSPALALWAMVPNVLPVLVVLGVMGWAGIPLDMSTLMIASVSLGMAVDGSIHYVTRYRAERAGGAGCAAALAAAHGSIGQAILYTAAAVSLGFCVLGLSNFKPTIYFGLLTSLSMAASLLASLTILPALLVVAAKDRP